MLNRVGSSGLIVASIAAVSIVLIIIVFIVFTDVGTKTINNLTEDKASVSVTVEGDIYVSQEQAIKNLKEFNAKSHKDLLKSIANQMQKAKQDTAKIANREMVRSEEVDKLFEVIENADKKLEEQQKILRMSANSENVIKVSVDNVSNYKLFYKNIDFKRDFFLAKLKELQVELDDNFLMDIDKNEAKKIYAQLTMIKSISYYLDYKPKEAYETYIRAKKAFPTLRVINELKKEYRDIYPVGAAEVKYAFALVASVTKSKENMEKTADKILSPAKAYKFRNKNYNLYLSIIKNTIRVYTIFEYHSKLELAEKTAEIEQIEKTAGIYKTTRKLPREYILKESRKKIYVFNTSGRNDDQKLVKKLKEQGIKHIMPRGRWGVNFDIYAIYYDGNSYDRNDLDEVLEATRDTVGSHAIKQYAYQQSNGKAIRDLFKDEYLKYVIILEKNSYINK